VEGDGKALADQDVGDIPAAASQDSTLAAEIARFGSLRSRPAATRDDLKFVLPAIDNGLEASLGNDAEAALRVAHSPPATLRRIEADEADNPVVGELDGVAVDHADRELSTGADRR